MPTKIKPEDFAAKFCGEQTGPTATSLQATLEVGEDAVSVRVTALGAHGLRLELWAGSVTRRPEANIDELFDILRDSFLEYYDVWNKSRG